MGQEMIKYGTPPHSNGLGARKKITWRRSAVDISCTPGWPCPETFAQKAEKEARGKAILVREEEIAEQLWNKAFTPKAQNASEAVHQLRLFYDAIEKYGDYDLKLKYSLQTSLYSPHVNLPGHWGVSWSHLKEKGQVAAKPYGYIPKFFPNILIAPHGYQIFGFLLRDLIFNEPRMKASAVAERAKKIQEYLTSIPADLGDFEGYNSAVMEWAKDFSIGPKTFSKRVDNLILMLKAWHGVPWGHPWFSEFIPSPVNRVESSTGKFGVGRGAGGPSILPLFYKDFRFTDASIAHSDYFPTTKAAIQGDIADYLAMINKDYSDLWEKNFSIRLDLRVKYLKKKLEAKEKFYGMISLWFQALSMVLMMFGGPAWFTIILVKIPKAVFEYAAMHDLTSQEMENLTATLTLIEMSADGITTLRLWIGERATLPVTLPPAPDGEGRYSLFLQERFIGRSDDTEELVEYAVLAGEIGDKVEIGDEDTNLPVGIGLITKNGIEWIPENVAGNFQNLGDSETRSLANSLVGDDGIPWWLVAVPLAVVVVAS